MGTSYDGDNQRVMKSASGTTTYYVRGPGGVLSEYDTGSGDGRAAWRVDYLYLGSTLLTARAR